MISSAWYAGWHGYDTDFPPEEMSWEKYNVVAYAFALTTENPGDIDVSDDNKTILKDVVKRAGSNVLEAIDYLDDGSPVSLVFAAFRGL